MSRTAEASGSETPAFRSAGTALRLLGEELRLHPTGAVYWPAQETLIVADLHFEKASAFAARGVLLPPYDTRETLRRLRQVMDLYAPRRVISLGDAFHDTKAETRLDASDRAALQTLISSTSWIWILGNHDPLPPEGVDGETADELQVGPLTFRHAPNPAPATGEVAGHLHPCAAIVRQGRRIRRRCIASDGARAILPAFGALTGGLNVLDPAFDNLFAGRHFHAWMIGAQSVYPVAARALIAD